MIYSPSTCIYFNQGKPVVLDSEDGKVSGILCNPKDLFKWLRPKLWEWKESNVYSYAAIPIKYLDGSLSGYVLKVRVELDPSKFEVDLILSLSAHGSTHTLKYRIDSSVAGMSDEHLYYFLDSAMSKLCSKTTGIGSFSLAGYSGGLVSFHPNALSDSEKPVYYQSQDYTMSITGDFVVEDFQQALYDVLNIDYSASTTAFESQKVEEPEELDTTL